MFRSDEEIERAYPDKATAYATGFIHGGAFAAIGSLLIFGGVFLFGLGLA